MNKLRKYGDCVTLDHFISRGEKSEGIHKEQDAVVMLDRYSDHMYVYPTPDKSAIHAYEALREWRGGTYLERVHTDGSKELKQAVAWFGFQHTTSTPGRPQRNGVIENRVGFIKRHASACCKQAGLPAKAWTWSCPYFCNAMNFAIKGGDSA